MITVIYDGHCDFCKSCVEWAKTRAPIRALPNQEINLADYGLNKEQVEKSVVVLSDKTYFGAAAVVQVLITTQNYRLARFITLLGPIGEIGYRYVASHRNGILVKSAHWFIKRDLNRN
jgi:predicted DCC family thiol-disulfide oxidoreductase YuxK